MPNVPGSGTALTSVVAAKQVGELPQKSPATWMFPKLIPLEVSALLRIRNSDWAVADPLASKQMVSCETPPHAPEESEKIPPTSVSVDVIPFSLTLPENPITGPPSRTEPDVICTATQTDVLEMLVPPHIPPWVRVAVPINVPPTDMLSVMVIESAEAAGSTAIAAATMTAKIKSLELLRTDVLLWRRRRGLQVAAGKPPRKLWKTRRVTEVVPAQSVTSFRAGPRNLKGSAETEKRCTLCPNECIPK
jgi:hypothetical protein